MAKIGDTVFTRHGTGRVIAVDSIHGNTSYKIAGNGFSVWLDGCMVHVSKNNDPSVDGIGRTVVNEDNETTLPYDPTPQYPVDLFRHVQTIQPGEYPIDPDKRLRKPVRSLTLDDAEANRPYPGPSPDLFSKRRSSIYDDDDDAQSWPRVRHAEFKDEDGDTDGGPTQWVRPDQGDDLWHADLPMPERTLDTAGSDLRGPRDEYSQTNTGQKSGAFSYFSSDDDDDDRYPSTEFPEGDFPDGSEPLEDDKWISNGNLDQDDDDEDFEDHRDYDRDDDEPDEDENESDFSVHDRSDEEEGAYTSHQHDHTAQRIAEFRRDPRTALERTAHVMTSGEEHHLAHLFNDYENLLASDKPMRVAAWKDVRRKAVRLRQDGNVHVHEISPFGIYATVQGDSSKYDTMILKGAGQSIDEWYCDCPWGKHAFLRKSSYVGRLCSHGYAAYLEMQSQRMKENHPFKTSSVVDDFKKWCEKNNDGNHDKGSLADFLRDYEDDDDLDDEQLESLYDFVEDHPSVSPERNFEVPYTFDFDRVYKNSKTADILRNRPRSVTPDLKEVPAMPEEWMDLLDDARETTGPDQIMYDGPGSHMTDKMSAHISRLLHADDGSDTASSGPTGHGWGLADPKNWNGIVHGPIGDATGGPDGHGWGLADPRNLPGFGPGKGSSDDAGSGAASATSSAQGNDNIPLSPLDFGNMMGDLGAGGAAAAGATQPGKGAPQLRQSPRPTPLESAGRPPVVPVSGAPGGGAPASLGPDAPGGGDRSLKNDTSYIVKPGDTLSDIADRAGFGKDNWKQMFDQNTGKPGSIGSDPNLIHPGESLQLRQPPADTPQAPDNNPGPGNSPGPGNGPGPKPSSNPLEGPLAPAAPAMAAGNLPGAQKALEQAYPPKSPNDLAQALYGDTGRTGSRRIAESSSESLLAELREMSDSPCDEHYQDMRDFNQKAREIIEELNNRGLDASFMVASLRHPADDGTGALDGQSAPYWADHPFAGSGPDPKNWYTDSIDYVDDHERPDFDTVYELQDKWPGYDSMKPEQGVKGGRPSGGAPGFDAERGNKNKKGGSRANRGRPKKGYRRSDLYAAEQRIDKLADAGNPSLYSGPATVTDQSDTNPSAMPLTMSEATNGIPAGAQGTQAGGGGYPVGDMHTMGMEASLHYADDDLAQDAQDDARSDEGFSDMNGGSIDMLANLHYSVWPGDRAQDDLPTGSGVPSGAPGEAPNSGDNMSAPLQTMQNGYFDLDPDNPVSGGNPDNPVGAEHDFPGGTDIFQDQNQTEVAGGGGAYSVGDILSSPQYDAGRSSDLDPFAADGTGGADMLLEGRKKKHPMKSVQRAGYGPRHAVIGLGDEDFATTRDHDDDFSANGTNAVAEGTFGGHGANPMIGIDGSGLEVQAGLVAQFQRSAAAQDIFSNPGASSGGQFDDLAGAASNFLKTAGRKFTIAEQLELEEEEHHLGARNAPTSADLQGTHYV